MHRLNRVVQSGQPCLTERERERERERENIVLLPKIWKKRDFIMIAKGQLCPLGVEKQIYDFVVVLQK